MHLLLTTLLLLPTLSLSLPAPALTTSTHSPAFRLKSHVLVPPTPSFENLYLEPYHLTSPSKLNYAVLCPQTAQKKGVISFLNGTTQELADGQGDLLVRGGEVGFVIGLSPFYQCKWGKRLTSEMVDSVNSTYNPIELNAGPGTNGIFIGQGVVKYNNPISGGFYGEFPYSG